MLSTSGAHTQTHMHSHTDTKVISLQTPHSSFLTIFLASRSCLVFKLALCIGHVITLVVFNKRKNATIAEEYHLNQTTKPIENSTMLIARTSELYIMTYPITTEQPCRLVTGMGNAPPPRINHLHCTNPIYLLRNCFLANSTLTSNCTLVL